MAKKKKNIESVHLSQEELIPSVIGVIEDKEKSNWILLIPFGLLIAFIIGLPTITAYFNGEKPIIDNPVVTPETPENPSADPEDKMQFYSLSNDLSVSIDGITFQRFVLDSNSMSMQISNDVNSKDYLVKHQFYVELYDGNRTLLQRIKLPNENISKGESSSYTFPLSIEKANVKQLVIEEKTKDDYPAVNLKKENDDTYSLTCVNDVEKLEYIFNKDQKLTSITDTINYASNEANYSVLLTDYRQMTSKYNAIDGVTSNIIEVNNGFTVTTNIKLEEVDFTNRSIKNTLNNAAYYGYETEGKVIYFELSAMNYICNLS